MLWLALHLPQLPLEVHTRASDRPLPAVVATQSGHQSCVLSVSPQAHRAGVYPGMTLSSAHALVAGLHVYRRDEEGEAAALRHLATLAITYTPIVNIAAPQTVLLEIEGSLKLFGGAERLQQRLHAEVRRLGYTASIAIAPTAFGAELLARANRVVFVRDADTLRTALHQLPLSVFDLAVEQQTALRDLGVRTLRELMRLPRAGLARRFGMALVDNMDRALGHRPDPRAQFKTPEQFTSTLHFPDAVTDAEALLFTARRQLQELSAFLQARCAGVRTVTWQLTHWRKPPSVLRIEAALVHRNARRFLDLLREQLHRQPLAGSVESISLIADQLTAYQEENASLLIEQRQPKHERALLVERLRARLGAEIVQGLNPVADHRPEFAQQLTAISGESATANHRLNTSDRMRRKLPPGAIGQTRNATAPKAIFRNAFFTHHTPSSRPLWLLPEPTLLAAPPIASQGTQPQWQGALTLESGPERIETGWWDGRPIARDYYIARSQNGARMWIYRERSGFTRGRARSRMPLANANAPSTAPRWFLHGLFS